MSRISKDTKYKFIVYKHLEMISLSIYVLKLLRKRQVNKILKCKIENNFKRIILRYYKEIMYGDE